MEALEACNHTELYQLCKLVGVKPVPQDSREDLMLLIIGDDENGTPADVHNVINVWRDGLYDFVDDHWKELQNQISCPLKSSEPKETRPVKDACYGCLDIQVLACVVSNPSNEAQIGKHRK